MSYGKRNPKEALASLAQARERASKRSEQFQVKQVENVYDTISDSEYAKLVEKNRAAGPFVVDDDGMGYDDMGEADLFGGEEEEYDDEVGKPKKSPKKRKPGALNAKPNKSKQLAKLQATVPSQRIQDAFLKKDSATKPSSSAEKFSKKFAPKKTGGDSALDALIDNLGEGDLDSLTVPEIATEELVANTPYSKDAKAIEKPKKKTSKPKKKEADVKIEQPSNTSNEPAPMDVDTTPADAQAASEVENIAGIGEISKAELEELLRDDFVLEGAAPPPPANQYEAPKQTKKKRTQEEDEEDAEDDFVDENHQFTGDDWWKIADQVEKELASGTLQEDKPLISDVPPKLTLQQNCLRLWWFDAHEDSVHKPGVLHIFGKAYDEASRRFVSCCVFVHRLERILHIATKPGVDMDNVRDEITSICKAHRITSIKTNVVTKNYAFEIDDVPKGESQFLELRYPYSEPSLPHDLKGQTFVHIFGATRSAMETFIINRCIKGPCWLTISNPIEHDTKRTWCALECSVNSPDDVSVTRFGPNEKVPPAPALTVMSIKVQTIMNHKLKQNEVVAVSALVKQNVNIDEQSNKLTQGFQNFTILRRLQGIPMPLDFDDAVRRNRRANIKIEATEKALLANLLTKIQQYDPDVFIGHNFIGYDLDVLLHRFQACTVPYWSRIGRLRLDKMPRLQKTAGGEGDASWAGRQVSAGRLLCDTYISAREFLRSQKNYKLTTLARSLLDAQRTEIDPDDIPGKFADSKKLMFLCENTLNDAFLAMSLCMKINILPLTKQLTELGGNLWNRSLMGARAERIEYLLLHKFHSLNYVLPDKARGEGGGKRKGKPAYEGGLVLDPKSGLYDKFVILLDFNSLYPSIIQEYNICFTTVERKKDDQGRWLPSEPPSNTVSKGILPTTIRELVEKRRLVKGLWSKATDPSEKQQLEIKQLAIKLVANSMYGCLGFKNSRFYAMPLAELITRKGRETLQKTVDIARNQLGLDVIYGDTDSIMINTNSLDLSEVKKIGNDVKKAVNKLYSNLEIDIDGIYKPMLLLKKKKYAALVVTEKSNGELAFTRQEKGLDLVRRDWCDLSVEMGRYVLDQILSGKPREDVLDEIHSYLRTQSALIREGKIPPEKFAISKTMTKKPEEYPDAHTQPHVQVALALRSQGRIVQVGETIPYIICKSDDASKQHLIAERAYHADTVRKEKLTPDYEWYLTTQIHPPIARLCEPIEGTDSAFLAQCLGLDPAKFSTGFDTTESNADVSFAPTVLLDERLKYKDVEKLFVTCMHCHQSREFQGIWSYDSPKEVGASLVCSTCQQPFSLPHLINTMVLFARKHIDRYYNGWYVCEDLSCGARTRHLVFYKKDIPRCMECANRMRLQYDTRMLYMQLRYLQALFDIEAFRDRILESGEKVDEMALRTALETAPWAPTFRALKTKADQLMSKCAFRWLSLASLTKVSFSDVLVADN